jgi:hypothetical protein
MNDYNKFDDHVNKSIRVGSLHPEDGQKSVKET